MIALRSDSLLFETSDGELIPCSAETVVVELVGDNSSRLDPALLRQAAAAVLHYFQIELQKESITVGEFAEALCRVLRSLGLEVQDPSEPDPKSDSDPATDAPTDLRQIAAHPDAASELFFFARLRDELKLKLARAPSVVHFNGLRDCVKRLARASRWSPRCERLQEQILEYLRRCFRSEPRPDSCVLLVH